MNLTCTGFVKRGKPNIEVSGDCARVEYDEGSILLMEVPAQLEMIVERQRRTHGVRVKRVFLEYEDGKRAG